MRMGDRLWQVLREGEELRPPGGSSEWSCFSSPSRAEMVQASGQAGKRPKSRVRTSRRDNISHPHLRKPQHASMGACCRWRGDDRRRLNYWNRCPFDPNLGLNIKYSWTGNKYVFIQFKMHCFSSLELLWFTASIWGCGAWRRRVFLCELLTWIHLLTGHTLTRQEGVKSVQVLDIDLKA